MLRLNARLDMEDDNQHLSTAGLRQRAAAILRSGRGQDGIREVTEILNIIQGRYRQRRDSNVSELPDAREPRR
jgi:hypothetical protein